jgi:hypothetical protein
MRKWDGLTQQSQYSHRQYHTVHRLTRYFCTEEFALLYLTIQIVCTTVLILWKPNYSPTCELHCTLCGEKLLVFITRLLYVYVYNTCVSFGTDSFIH